MLNPKRNILFELYLIGRMIQAHTKQGNTDNVQDAFILDCITKETCTISDIADKLDCQISAISEKLSALKQKGWIKKTSASDQRQKIIQLTPKGLRIVKKFNTVLQSCSKTMLRDLSKKDCQRLIVLLQKINSP